MKMHAYWLGLGAGALLAGVPLFGVELLIDNNTGIPFIVRVLKENARHDDIRISSTGIQVIGYLADKTRSNVSQILELDFVEGWKHWSKRLVTREDLPEFTTEDAVRLGNVIDKLKTALKKQARVPVQCVIKVGIEKGRLTFKGSVEEEWHSVSQ